MTKARCRTILFCFAQVLPAVARLICAAPLDWIRAVNATVATAGATHVLDFGPGTVQGSAGLTGAYLQGSGVHTVMSTAASLTFVAPICVQISSKKMLCGSHLFSNQFKEDALSRNVAIAKTLLSCCSQPLTSKHTHHIYFFGAPSVSVSLSLSLTQIIEGKVVNALTVFRLLHIPFRFALNGPSLSIVQVPTTGVGTETLARG